MPLVQLFLHRLLPNLSSENVAIRHISYAVFGIADLRAEIFQLYGQYGIDYWHTGNSHAFHQFIGAILDTIAEHPLSYPPGIASKTGKPGKIYAEARQLTGDEPHFNVTKCLVTNDLSQEQLDFYGVPAGTYVWQIETEANNAICGILRA